MKSPFLSIIIVNYNVKDLLINCIKSIYHELEKEDVDLIIIDNNSSDGSRENITSIFPKIIWVQNNHNAGFSGANNQGGQLAKAPFLLLLNPDTEIVESSLKRMIDNIKINDDLIYAPRLLNSDGSLQISCWKFPGILNIITELFLLHSLFNTSRYSLKEFSKDFFPETASGAALLFSKEIWKKTGGLNPDLFWSEDIDFCKRARNMGVKIKYLSECPIIHHSGKSSIHNLNVVIPNQLISKLKYIEKHHSYFEWLFSVVLIFFHILTRIAMFTSLSITPSLLFKSKRIAYIFALKAIRNYVFHDRKAIVI